MAATMRQGDSNPEGFEWIELADFSAGIYSDRFGADHSRLLDGAATVANTYGCYADTSGALCPFPARTAGVTQTLPPSGNADGDTSHYPEGRICAYVTDGVVGFHNTLNAMYAHGEEWDYPAVGYAFWYDPTGSGADSAKHLYFLARLYNPEAESTLDFVFAKGDNAEVFRRVPTMQFVVGIGADDNELVPDPPRATHLSGFIATLVRPDGLVYGGDISSTDGGLTDYDTRVSRTRFTTPTYLNSQGRGYVSIFPDLQVYWEPTPSISLMDFDAGFAYPGTLITQHQGRLVVAMANLSGTSIFGGHWLSGIEYNVPLEPMNVDGDHATLATSQDEPTRIGAMGSLTAGELLLVHTSGGAVLVRGDLDNPQIVRMPFVESTGGVVAVPVATPLGLVYGAASGVWVWSGGDRSEHLSPQIEGMFWRHELDREMDDYSASRGRFGYWHPFVFAPNNYFFDIRSHGWWRIDPPGDGSDSTVMPYNAYDVSRASNRLFAFHYKLTPEWNTPYSIYSWDELRSYYTWQSQPLIRTRRDNLLFRQLELVATAHPDATNSTVTVTLTGYDRDGVALTPASATFSLTENGCVSYRLADIRNFQARYVQVRIEAESDTGPAPKVHAIRLATVPGNPIPKG